MSRKQTIAAIYETVIRHELSDRFSRSPESNISENAQATSDAELQRLRVDPDLQLHFARAGEILEQQWVRSGSPSPAQFFEGGDTFWILLDGDGKIARASRSARSFLQGKEETTLAALGLDAATQDRATQLLQRRNRRALPEILVAVGGSRKLMCRTVQCGHGLQITHGVMIEALDFEWSKNAQDMVSATFGLHQQEMLLLGGFLAGNSLSDLAEKTRGGLTSVKAQLRVILTKSGAPGLAEMLRLFCFLMNEVARDENIESGAVSPPEGQVQFTGGQCLQFYKLGADTGQPVIFLHGLLDGIAGVQRLQSQFRKRGFRIYAPLRSGYGRSGPILPQENGFDHFIDQLETLIKQENLQRPILLGHRGGSVFAHIAARRLRDKAAGAVIVSGLGPVQHLGQLSALTGHRRMMVVTAAYSPKLMPLVVKRWARSIRKKSPLALVRQPSQTSSDAKGLGSIPHLTDLLQASHKMSLDQNGSGMMADFQWIVNDWQRHIDGHSTPVIYLHGEEDKVTPVARLQRAMAGRPNVQVRLCRGGGAMLLYTRPELVFAALEELADR